MWGALSVTSDYGSLLTKGGSYFVRPVSSMSEAREELDKVSKVRKQHGYRVALDPHEQLLKADSSM